MSIQQGPMIEVIKQHLEKVKALVAEFTKEFYETYDQHLNGITDPVSIEQTLEKVDQAGQEKMQKLKQDLVSAQKELAKSLETAAGKVDASVLADLEQQIDSL